MFEHDRFWVYLGFSLRRESSDFDHQFVCVLEMMKNLAIESCM